MAILLVLLWHYGVGPLRFEPDSLAANIAKWFHLTWSGVDLFFVLSGFLIGGILLDNKEKPNYFKAFYIRRICRIFPLYYLWLLLFISLTLAAPTLAAETGLFRQPLPLWSYATFTQNFMMAQTGTFGPNWLGITWSLAVEEQFYFVLPFIIRFVASRALPYVLTGLIIAAPVLRLLMLNAHPYAGFAAYVLMPCRADALLLGVMCAYIVRQKETRQWLTERTKLLYSLLAVLLLGAAISIYQSSSDLSFYRSFRMASYGYSWIALLYACLLLIAVTERQGVVTMISRNVLLRNLGHLAYGIYLFHQAINGLQRLA